MPRKDSETEDFGLLSTVKLPSTGLLPITPSTGIFESLSISFTEEIVVLKNTLRNTNKNGITNPKKAAII